MIIQKNKLKAICKPGLRVALELAGLNDKAPSIVIGGEPPRYLVIKEPMMHPSDKHLWSEYLYSGNEATVRYIHDGVASGFKTQIVKLINAPEKLLFLKYPKRIETYNLRKHRRVNCFLEAEVALGGDRVIAVVEDLSSSGCCVTYIKDEHHSDPQIEDTLKVFCPYFTADEDKAIPCIVQRTTKDSRKITLGVTFNKPAPEILIRIQDYVATILNHA